MKQFRRLLPLFLIASSLSAQFPMFKAPTEEIKRKWLDLPYASLSEAQKLDIYLPDEGDGPFPVILAIHGGAFLGGDKADGQLTPMLEGLRRGYAVVSINHRLSSEATFPAAVHDVKAAVRWLRAHAEEYKLDGTRIVAWGPSAGGYLAAMAGVTCGVAELEDLSLGNADYSSCVQAVVDWFGPINFLTMDEQFRKSGKGRPNHGEADSPASLFMGRRITEIPEKVAASNPESYLSVDDPPILIMHGTDDPVVPVEQSIEFAEKLGRIIGSEKCRLILLSGAGHGGPQFSSPETLNQVFEFIDRVLKD
ncbi:MAG: alpha/beta hydrolase [candidate division KSB1 bacterium]|nr:alpha/beta hydrolase [candidate division KSB1 bacterium]MDZ7346293.1 alpha/beta hydrolase [candidate division KSB1 bacterium]